MCQDPLFTDKRLIYVVKGVYLGGTLTLEYKLRTDRGDAPEVREELFGI